MNIRFFSEDGDGTLLPMLPQQAITPAGKETAPVEEAYSLFFSVALSESRTLTTKWVETDELKN